MSDLWLKPTFREFFFLHESGSATKNFEIRMVTGFAAFIKNARNVDFCHIEWSMIRSHCAKRAVAWEGGGG